MSFKIYSNFRPESSPTYDTLKEVCKGKPITFFYDYIPKRKKIYIIKLHQQYLVLLSI